MTRSNSEVIEELFAIIEGVDVAPSYRALEAGEMTNVATEVRAYLAEWFELLDADFEWDTSALDFPERGIVRGWAQFAEFWRRWLAEWEHYRMSVENVTTVGDDVLFDIEIRGTGTHSGVEVVWHHTQIWTFRDDQVIRMSQFKDRAAALAATAR